ncbi:MAG: response regulator [Alphaproteobacteria bacterium]
MKRFIAAIIIFLVFLLCYEIYDSKTKRLGDEKFNTNFTVSFSSGEEKWIKQNPKIKIGAFKDFYPYSFMEAKEKFAGVAATYLDIISEKSGLDFEIVWFDNIEDAVKAFDSREIDYFAVSKSTDSELKTDAIYSIPYFSGVGAIFTSRENKLYVNSVKDIEGKEVAVDKDTYKHSRTLKKGKFIPHLYSESVMAVNDVNNGKAFAFVGDLLHIKGIIQKYNFMNVHFATTYDSKNYNFSFVTHKENELFIEIVNNVIEQIDVTNSQKIIDKWIYSNSAELEKIKLKYTKYGVITSSIFALFILIFLIKIYSLKRYDKYINLLKEDYERLLDEAPVAFFTQKNNLITYVNEEFVKLLGGKKEDFINVNYHKFIDEQNLRLALKQITGNMARDIRLTRLDNNKSIYVNLKRISIKFREEDLVLIMVIDVTDRKAVEQEKRNILKKTAASQKMEMIGMLSGRVAHDFNNILTGINGSAEFIELTLPEKSNLKKYTNIIVKACKSAAYLTKELLVFAKNKDAVFSPLNVNEVSQGCVELLRNAISNYKNTKIETKFSAKKPYIYGNEDLFQNLIINLGLNAKDALKEGGKIFIQTKNVKLSADEIKKMIFKTKEGSYVELLVEDNGTGMSKEVLKNIFEPFYTTKAKGKGTGLGMLAISNIVKEHRANMKIVSVVNEGTKFYIYFPVISGKAKAKEKIKEESNLQKINAKILIVDDELVLLELLKDILEHLGCEVLSANNYEKAIEAYQAHNDIDLVLLDVIMPEKSGLDVYEDLKKMNPDLRAMFVTGYSKDKKVGEIVASNSNLDLINKPYNISDITDKLLNLLAKK